MSPTITALVVHDSDVVLRHVAALLQKKGLRVDTAATLEMAIKAFSLNPTDILIVAVTLQGGQSGLDLLSKIPEDKRPKGFAIMAPETISRDDREKAKSLNCKVLPKLIQKKENDFIQEVFFWLKDIGLIR